MQKQSLSEASAVLKIMAFNVRNGWDTYNVGSSGDIGAAITTSYASSIDHVFYLGKRITVSEYKMVTGI